MPQGPRLSQDEVIHRNVELGIIFTDGIIDGTITDDVPAGVTLALLREDDPDLLEENLQIGISAMRRGEDVYFRYVRRETGQCLD